MKYDFIVLGRWRTHEQVAKVRDAIRAAGFTCYCFIDNSYYHHGKKFSRENVDAMMKEYEGLPYDSPDLREIYEKDIAGLRNAAAVVLAMPAGTSSLIESGIAFGMGKPVYAVQAPDARAKSETLYNIFDKIFADLDEFKKFLEEGK